MTDMHDLSQLRDAARDAAGAIAQRPNVLFVTLGQKRVKGQRTEQQALVAYVSKKTDVRKTDLIPKRGMIRRSGRRNVSLPTTSSG